MKKLILLKTYEGRNSSPLNSKYETRTTTITNMYKEASRYSSPILPNMHYTNPKPDTKSFPPSKTKRTKRAKMQNKKEHKLRHIRSQPYFWPRQG